MEFNTDLKMELSKYSFEYFLNRINSENNYSNDQISIITASYKSQTKELNELIGKNKKQAFLFCQNMVGLMVEGRMILNHFRLSSSREVSILDFEAYGKDWAYFDKWQQLFLSKLRKEKFWNLFIKVGAGLGIILSIIKLLETFCII